MIQNIKTTPILMTMIYNLVAIAFLLLAILTILAWFFGDHMVVLNVVSGYVSTMIVIASSAFGYYRLVDGADRVATNHNLPDITDQIDDKYGLWEEKSDAIDDPKEILKQQKLHLKRSKKGLKSIIKMSKPAISIYRLVAYAILIMIVYRLISKDMFDAVAFLLGSTASSLFVAGYLYYKRSF